MGGNGNIIEIDESKFGRREYNKGHHVDGVWVFGGVKRNTRKIFSMPVKNRNKNILEKLLRRQVNPYSIIYSDCWKAYSSISSIFYTHRSANHSKEFINKLANAHINTIEGTWNAI